MRKQEITDLESLDHAYVVAPNKIDENRKANLIKSFFKPWPLVRFRKHPPFRATVLSQCTPINAGSLRRVGSEQVEITWSVRYAPLTTASTRSPYAIYLKYRKTKGEQNHREGT
jgi:hypothetical protein